MRRNVLLRKSAPGETRTPNLLIRSQSHPSYLGLRRTRLEWERAPEGDVETPKADETSHNNSHNRLVPRSEWTTVRLTEEQVADMLSMGSIKVWE